MDCVEGTCTVCHEVIDIFAFGECEHPICYRCSTRLRVLCEQMYCPICRGDMPQVLFVKKFGSYADFNQRSFILNHKQKILFEDKEIKTAYHKLLEHRCSKCRDRQPENSFQALMSHMRKQHTLFYCDLCVKHLKMFTRERKVYTRSELATHRRLGDPDDKSYKGHPLCHFCDERYMDRDELHRHLRKDHFFCHFCDSDGGLDYYNEYADLKQHFADQHYLCQEGECGQQNTRFTHAFHSEIDLKAHRSTCHQQLLSKTQAKEARTLDIEFNYTNRPRRRERGATNRYDYEDVQDRPRSRGHHYRGAYYEKQEEADVNKAMELSLKEALKVQRREQEQSKGKTAAAASGPPSASGLAGGIQMSVEDFPSLHGEDPSAVKPQKVEKKQPEEDFPLLQNVNSNVIPKTPQVPPASLASRMSRPASAQSTNQSPKPTRKPGKAAAPVQDKPAALKWGKPKMTGDDFPELRGGHPAHVTNNATTLPSQGTWISKAGKNTRPVSGPQNDKTEKVDVGSKPTKLNHSSLAAIGGSLCDDREFPSLGGKKYSPQVSNNSWGKTDSSAKKDKKVKTTDSKTNPPSNFTSFFSENLRNGNVVTSDSKKSEKSKKKKKKDKSNGHVETETREERHSKPPDPSDSSGEAILEQTLDGIATGLLLDKSSGHSSPVMSSVQDSPELPTPQHDTNMNSKEFSRNDVHSTLSALTPVPPSEEDYPSLSSSRKSQPSVSNVRAPPGFLSQSIPAAPPGFGKAQSQSVVPPGFEASPLSLSTLPLTPQLENFEYSQPTNFSQRNKSLVQNISDLMSNDQLKFDRFKSLSGRFRQGQLSAGEYNSSCQELIGVDKYPSIFPELIALLPDINKQQELFKAYTQNQSKSANNVLKISAKTKKAPWEVCSEIITCPTCRQIVTKTDYTDHLLQHGQLSDFPTLGSAGCGLVNNRGAEIKAK